MSNCAIVGINWGDEGKGRMVDLLTERFDYVVRYQGGGNAGHTVVNPFGKFALHLLPSGIFRPGVVNVLGNGVALDLENLWTEIESLRAAGISITPENLKISERPGSGRAGGSAAQGQKVRLHQAGDSAVLFRQISEENAAGRGTELSGTPSRARERSAGLEESDADGRLRGRALFP